jgi:anti-sigma regulatory factor (Ser/Thr protein kinase)
VQQQGWRLALPSAAEAVPKARHAVVAQLESWGRHAVVEAAALVVSELVTNAVLHARTPLDVTLDLEGTGVRLSVRDLADGLPHRRESLSLAATGRGIVLLEAFARSWGVDQHPDGGKTVWALLTEDSVVAAEADPQVEPVAG